MKTYVTVSVGDSSSTKLPLSRSASEHNMARESEFAFFRACRTGELDKVRGCLAKGIPSEARDRDGLTGLIWASRAGNIKVAELLLQFGAKINVKDANGRTPLHYAVGHRNPDFIRFAAEQGAHLNLVDVYGCTALDLATILQHPEVIGVLELLGAERVRTESRGTHWNGSQTDLTRTTRSIAAREQGELPIA